MCVQTLLRVAFFFWARPRKTGDTECTEQGGASHEREQSTKAHLRKSVPMRGLPLVRWSVLRRSRRGESRWTPPVREARLEAKLEGQIECWNEMLFHIDLWSKKATRRERPDVVELLQDQREQATSAIERAYEELNMLRRTDTSWRAWGT